MTTITASKTDILAPYIDDISKYQRMYQEEKLRADLLQDDNNGLRLQLQDIAGDLGSMNMIAGKL